MKKTLFTAYLALLICLVPAFSMAWSSPPGAVSPAPSPSAARAEPSPSPAAKPVPSAPPRQDIELIYGEDILSLPMEEYLIGVVAAEMPASFQPEALKAQAVAARSYALYCIASGKHDSGRICADFRCCQAWSEDESLRSRWGADYDKYRQAVSQAVQATAGQYLSYEGQAIFAAFHSSSAGATEDCGAIWSPLPYLVSVSSPETAQTVPGFVSQVELSPLDFRDTILSACPEADMSGDASAWLGAIEPEASGRVASVEIGGSSISGEKLRSLFSLRSTAFSLEYTGSAFLFTVKGHGHGVGMSQYGAEHMAAEGQSYAQILAHYYPGTQLTDAGAV